MGKLLCMERDLPEKTKFGVSVKDLLIPLVTGTSATVNRPSSLFKSISIFYSKVDGTKESRAGSYLTAGMKNARAEARQRGAAVVESPDAWLVVNTSSHFRYDDRLAPIPQWNFRADAKFAPRDPNPS
jgi:hypothetical protein